MTIAVDRVASSVFGVFTTSMSGMTATGVKKWKPTRRSGCFSLAPICSTESDEVFVASTASWEMYCSTSAKTSCFTDELLEDGLDDPVAVGEVRPCRSSR